MSARLVVAAVAIAFAPGCFWFTTKVEGQRMRADVDDLETRMARQEESVDEKTRKLDASIDAATKLLTRNSADLGADVEKQSAELAALNGEVQTLKRELEASRADLTKATAAAAAYEARIADLVARLETIEKTQAAAAAVADRDALYDGAYRKLQSGAYEDARKAFRSFLQSFRGDPRAERAQYFIGESFYREKQYEKAIAEFQRLIDAWPRGELVDDAFFQAGMAASSMKWCTDAGAYFGVLLERFPGSPFAKTAKEKLDHLKKNAKNKRVCQS